MTNEGFKELARANQIRFKRDVLHIAEGNSPVRTIRWVDRETGQPRSTSVKVESCLLPDDLRDDKGGYVIFYPGFRGEITEAIDSVVGGAKGPLVSNLLRSEHIPYNVFFPMTHDLEGAAGLMNDLLGGHKISRLDEIKIEYNPGGLYDGTSFDVYMSYTGINGERGGIGIEVKYTEKEYQIKRGSKEWNETHDEHGIHLADNYLIPTRDSGWFRERYYSDIPIDEGAEHLVANRYRQIWRNHILGASMVLGLACKPEESLDEFTSLTVYPEGNGHFSEELWHVYADKLTAAGQATVRHITYEELFPKMRRFLSAGKIPRLADWIDYLEDRYYVN